MKNKKFEILLDLIAYHDGKQVKRQKEDVETCPNGLKLYDKFLQSKNIYTKEIEQVYEMHPTTIFFKSKCCKHMANLNDKYDVVPANKAPSNIVLCVNLIS